MVSNPGFHCRGNAQGFVNAAKVVVHEVAGYRVLKVFNLLAEAIGQAGKAAHSPMSIKVARLKRVESVIKSANKEESSSKWRG
jgi:hypothetical protein